MPVIILLVPGAMRWILKFPLYRRGNGGTEKSDREAAEVGLEPGSLLPLSVLCIVLGF